MLKGLFIVVASACMLFLVFNNASNKTVHEPPSYLQNDEISKIHNTNIKVHHSSIYRPDSMEIDQLKKDYGNLWAHLNHLYATNDVKAGKKYYTEDWFKHISNRYEGVAPRFISREDVKHELHIINWSWDGLVCCAIDSNVIFRYQLPDGSVETTKATLGVVLLYQGRNWRIDAMRIFEEKSY